MQYLVLGAIGVVGYGIYWLVKKTKSSTSTPIPIVNPPSKTTTSQDFPSLPTRTESSTPTFLPPQTNFVQNLPDATKTQPTTRTNSQQINEYKTSRPKNQPPPPSRPPTSRPSKQKKVYGYFRCRDCKKKWESSKTWILNGKPLGQQCKRCKSGFVSPYKTAPLEIPQVDATFECPEGHEFIIEIPIDMVDDELEVLCPKCDKWYDLECTDFEDDSKIDPTKPHLSEFCEMCQRTGRNCTQMSSGNVNNV